MTQITDPVALAFLNSRLRPRAQAMRQLLYQLNEDSMYWTPAIQALFANDADTISDRQAEGVPTITAADVKAFVALCQAILALPNPPTAAFVLCVNPGV